MSLALRTPEAVRKDCFGRTVTTDANPQDLSQNMVMEFGWKMDTSVSSDPIPCEKGLVDSKAKIQSFARDCDIKTILQRINANGGDLSVAQIKPGVYGDATMLPDAGLDYLNSGRSSGTTLSRMAEALGLDPAVVAKLSPEQVQVLFDDQIKKLAAQEAAKTSSSSETPKTEEAK